MHVVIIGFSDFDIPEKRIFEYENINGEPQELRSKNVNPYLIEGNNSLNTYLYTIMGVNKKGNKLRVRRYMKVFV